MTKNTTLQFCNETIHPGEKLSLALPLPQLFSCAPMYMPIKVMHGKAEGKTLLITAAIHGNEIIGTAIINELFSKPSLAQLRGTLIAVPVMNVYGLINRSRYLPGGIDLDRCFPGNENGTNAQRLANLFMSEVWQKADYCIHLQTGPLNHTNLPQVFIDPGNPSAQQLAEAFNAPVISNYKIKEGSLRAQAAKDNLPLLIYQAGEAMRFDNYAIKTGIDGIMNVLRKLDMLPAKSKKEKRLKSLHTEESLSVRAASSGISHTKRKLGERIKKGDVLCTLKDPFGASDDSQLHSPQDGIIVEINNQPLIHEGETLFELATFPELKKAETQLEAWQEKIDTTNT